MHDGRQRRARRRGRTRSCAVQDPRGRAGNRPAPARVTMFHEVGVQAEHSPLLARRRAARASPRAVKPGRTISFVEAFMTAVNLAERLTTFQGHYQPRVVGQFNGHDLLVAKFQGEFVWHQHEDTDRLLGARRSRSR